MTGRRPLLLAAVTLLATFGAGAAVGAAVERGRAPAAPPAPAAESRPGARPPVFAEGPLDGRLELTRAQRDSISLILTRDRARADSLYREFRPRLRSRFDSTAAAVEAVLTPEQREEWRRIRQERRGRWRDGERGPRPERRRPGARAVPPDDVTHATRTLTTG